VTVDYSTAPGTATSGVDYVPASGTLTFLPGETTKTITVLVNGDTLDEPDETLFVNLSNASNATISVSQGTGTILDDDPAPAFSISNASVVEGNSGTVLITFTVTLNTASGKITTVDYSTADGTATAGVDYVANSGTLTFLPGETSKSVSFSVFGDLDVESDETFFVNLSNAGNATIANAQGVGTILNDDVPGNPLELTGFDVQRGAAQRSFVRYVTLGFNQSNGLADIISSINDANPSNDRARLLFRGLDGTGSTPVSISNKLSAIDRVIEMDFGTAGITGNAAQIAGDGYYTVELDLDNNGSFETKRTFFRLLGDATGNGVVNDDDVNLVNAAMAIGKTGANLEEDVNGDGVVNNLDRWLATKSKGRAISGGIGIDD
jgi:hypothetical protein